MGFFSDDSKENEVKNIVTLSQEQSVSMENRYMEITLIIITVLLVLMLLMKVFSLIRKATKNQVQNEQLILRTLNKVGTNPTNNA